MLYYTLKILHILSAALLLTSFVYSLRIWKQARLNKIESNLSDQMNSLTWLGIIPFALLQLLTGFTMISLKQYAYTDIWVIGSVEGFIIVIVSWFAFMYCLAHQYKILQKVCISSCVVALFSMIFFMSTRLGSV